MKKKEPKPKARYAFPRVTGEFPSLSTGETRLVGRVLYYPMKPGTLVLSTKADGVIFREDGWHYPRWHQRRRRERPNAQIYAQLGFVDVEFSFRPRGRISYSYDFDLGGKSEEK